MERLCKTAKTLDTVAKLIRTFVIIVCVVSLVVMALVGGILLFDWNPAVWGEAELSVILGSVKLSVSPDFELPFENLMYHALVDMALFLALSVFTFIAIKYIRTILLPMTEGEPFRDVVAVSLKKLAWLTILYGVVRMFLLGLEGYLINTLYSDTLQSLAEGSHITGILYENEGDMTFLIVAGVLFLLSYVFRYAQELQKLSDETL